MIQLLVLGVEWHSSKNTVKLKHWCGVHIYVVGNILEGDLFKTMAKYLVFTIICNIDDEPNKLVALGEVENITSVCWLLLSAFVRPLEQGFISNNETKQRI